MPSDAENDTGSRFPGDVETPSTVVSLSPATRRAGRLVFIATLAVYLFTTGGSMATDSMTYEVTKSIVERGSVAMPGKILALEAHRGVDGRYYAPYGIGHALYSVPFYMIGRIVEVNLGFNVGRPDAVRKAAFVLGSAVAAALTVWIVFLFAWRLTGDMSASIATAFIVAFGTLLWPYSKYGFNAAAATLAVTAGVYAVWVGRRSDRIGPLVFAGVAFGGALLIRPELTLAGVVAIVWFHGGDGGRWSRSDGFSAATPAPSVIPERIPSLLALALPIAAAIAGMFAYNHARFGSIWDSGYLRDSTATFNAPRATWEGFLGLLVSPGRSLFFYSPIVIAGVAALVSLFRRDRSTAWLLAGVTLALFGFYITLEYWDADRSYGPRYLVPVLPLLCLPLAYWLAAALRARWLAWLVALSVAVQIPGVAIDFTKALPALGVSHPLLERRWNWEVAGLTLNTRAFARFAPDNIRYLTGAATPPEIRAPVGRGESFSDQFGYSLDFWWLYLFYFRKVSALTALALAASLGLVAAWCVRALRTART